MSKFRSSEIVATSEGKQYHIDLAPGELAEYVLLCGDPARAHRAGALLRDVSVHQVNREFVTFTGTWKGLGVSVVSTGIGTDNVEIVFVEALQLFPENKPTFIRAGSCGGLLPNIGLGDLVISSGAVRLENTSLFFVDQGYPAVAHHEVVIALIMAADRAGSRYHVGLTASASGFYGAQGRNVPNLRPKDTGLPERLATQNVLNFEMESSTLFTLGNLVGTRTGTVCAVYANRRLDTFIDKTDKEIAEETCLRVGLDALKILYAMDLTKNKRGVPYYVPNLTIAP